MVPDRRLSRLARRVRWLDRYRRLLAITVAGCVVVFLFEALPNVLGSDWPVFHARAMAIIAGVMVAFLVEVALASLLAWWELQIDHLQRSTLPRAIVKTRR